MIVTDFIFTLIKMSCLFVDPDKRRGRYVTNSFMASAYGLLACVKYKISIEKILYSWHSAIQTIALPAYKEAKKRHMSDVEIVKYVIDALTREGTCYEYDSDNFMYTLYKSRGCNCMCSTTLIYAVFEVLDKKILKNMYFVVVPKHILLYIKDGEKWYNFETTSYTVSKKDWEKINGKWVSDSSTEYVPDRIIEHFNVHITTDKVFITQDPGIVYSTSIVLTEQVMNKSQRRQLNDKLYSSSNLECIYTNRLLSMWISLSHKLKKFEKIFKRSGGSISLLKDVELFIENYVLKYREILVKYLNDYIKKMIQLVPENKRSGHVKILYNNSLSGIIAYNKILTNFGNLAHEVSKSVQKQPIYEYIDIKQL